MSLLVGERLKQYLFLFFVLGEPEYKIAKKFNVTAMTLRAEKQKLGVPYYTILDISKRGRLKRKAETEYATSIDKKKYMDHIDGMVRKYWANYIKEYEEVKSWDRQI
jgi:hypothetical protein